MIVSAALFAGLAILGALVGLEHVGHPMSGQSVNAYGWGLCVNATAISLFLIYFRVQRAYLSMR
jgi:hypothetical protein